MDFYRKLFKKIKYHLGGGEYGRRMNLRDTPELKAMRESYAGMRGTARLGKDITRTILRRIIGRER